MATDILRLICSTSLGQTVRMPECGLGTLFKANQGPSNIEGWELEMIEVESLRYVSEWNVKLAGRSSLSISNDKSRRGVRVVQVKKLKQLLVDFLQNCDFSSISAKVRRLHCKSALIVPFLCILHYLLPSNNHLRWIMTTMIKSYDRHCSWWVWHKCKKRINCVEICISANECINIAHTFLCALTMLTLAYGIAESQLFANHPMRLPPPNY